MRPRFLPAALAAFLILCVGCDQKGRFVIPGGGSKMFIKPPVAQPPAPAAPGAPIGSEGAAGVWTGAQVEQYVTDNLKLASIKLERASGDDYRGTGVGQDGTNYSFEAKQVPGSIDVRWANDRGGSGGMTFGKSIP